MVCVESGCADFCCGVCSEKFPTLRKLGQHYKKEHTVVKKKIRQDDFLKTLYDPVTPDPEDLFEPLNDFLNTLGPDDWKQLDVQIIIGANNRGQQQW